MVHIFLISNRANLYNIFLCGISTTWHPFGSALKDFFQQTVYKIANAK